MMTNQFEGFNVELSQCDWYLLSIEMRRMYVIFVSDTQHSIKILSYANIACERDTSKKVIKWVNIVNTLNFTHFFLFSVNQHGIFILYDDATIQSIESSQIDENSHSNQLISTEALHEHVRTEHCSFGLFIFLNVRFDSVRFDSF